MEPLVMDIKKWLISAWLVFHIIAVVTFPNPMSRLRIYLAPAIYPYLNFLGMNSTWSFYAPEPDYTVGLKLEKENIVNDETVSSTEFFGRKSMSLFQRPLRLRIFGIVASQWPDVATKDLAPWFCKTDPTLQHIKIFHQTLVAIQPSDLAQGLIVPGQLREPTERLVVERDCTHEVL